MKNIPARRLLAAVGILGLGAAAAVPLLHASGWIDCPRNFHVVEEGVLYRSGQLTPAAFGAALDKYHIRTVVTLRSVRDLSKPYPDNWEYRVCEARGLRHVRIVPRRWDRDSTGKIPAADVVSEFLAVMDDPASRPVLVHCFAGSHRTGAMCAIFRMEYQGWTPDEAIGEMHECGFEPGGGREYIEDFLRNYRPR